MNAAAMLLWCVATHIIWLHISPLVWLVPDLTLLGVVLAVSTKPERWFALSLLAGAATTLWLVRWLPFFFLGTIAVGWIVREVTRHWDARDVRIQALLVILSSAAMTLGALGLDQLCSLSIWAMAILHVAMTLLALPIAKRVLDQERREWFGANAQRLTRHPKRRRAEL